MAAGLGFKTFTTGEVLTAADTNGYLMQGVLVFASSAARAAAITSPQEGQYSYLKDTNSTEYYDGAAWIAAPIGDITGVTAGTGISGGGTSGTVTVSIDTAVTVDKTTAQTLTNKTLTSPALTTPTISTATTNGDLLYGTGSGALTRLGIGSSAQVLTVASGVPSWATPASGGGMTLLDSGSLTGASVTTATLSTSYQDLKIVLRDVLINTDGRVWMRVNGVSAANSYSTFIFSGYNNGAFNSDYMGLTLDMDNSVNENLVVATIPDYANATTYKMVNSSAVYVDATNTAYVGWMQFGASMIKGTAAITSLTFLSTASSFSAGTYYVYGVK
jgi:hypothetical protein